MLITGNVRVLAQQHKKCWTDKSSWTYNSTAGSPTVTILTAAPPTAGDLVSLKPNGGGFVEQICEVLTVSAGVSFTVEALGTTATVAGGTFTSTGQLTVFKWTMPKNTMGINDSIEIELKHFNGGNAALQKIHYKLDGTDFATNGWTNVAVISGNATQKFSNRNSYSSQIGGINDSASASSYNIGMGVAIPTLTKNTLTTDLVISVTYEKGSATMDAGLESCIVKLYQSVQGLTYL